MKMKRLKACFQHNPEIRFSLQSPGKGDAGLE
jgi:hypothetical protein